MVREGHVKLVGVDLQGHKGLELDVSRGFVAHEEVQVEGCRGSIAVHAYADLQVAVLEQHAGLRAIEGDPPAGDGPQGGRGRHGVRSGRCDLVIADEQWVLRDACDLGLLIFLVSRRERCVRERRQLVDGQDAGPCRGHDGRRGCRLVVVSKRQEIHQICDGGRLGSGVFGFLGRYRIGGALRDCKLDARIRILPPLGSFDLIIEPSRLELS
mmetsp:Transcript_3501/g.10189  ORF Transcript_3501/g.10189 Transcript_3501/m.10189 type:complete len:212 (+) Transcript_3501:363-998(+)